MPYADLKSDRARETGRKNKRIYYTRHREAEIRRAARWNQDNGARISELNAIRRSQKTPMATVLWRNAKNRSIAKGIPFDITIEDIIVPELCPVLGLRLEVATGCAKDNSPSLDRKDTTRGYVRGNIQVISHKANTIKSNATAADLRLVLAYVERDDG